MQRPGGGTVFGLLSDLRRGWYSLQERRGKLVREVGLRVCGMRCHHIVGGEVLGAEDEDYLTWVLLLCREGVGRGGGRPGRPGGRLWQQSRWKRLGTAPLEDPRRQIPAIS